MMATPADLTDFATGFSLTEAIIRQPCEIEDLDIVRHHDGIELRMWLSPERGHRLSARRRRLVGPTGCGLCGIESLADATPPVPSVTRGVSLTPRQISDAVQLLSDAQELNHATRATHAAGFYLPEAGLTLLREDVGRHNAFDKLAGALAAEGVPGSAGALVLTSRVSIELVQKAASVGIGFLIAVSAPTALAVRTATTCGMTLVGIARGREFEIFSHAEGVTTA
jgi:FdhD protein